MGFFRKSGNSRGVFPDSSIEEKSSLFTNEDERDASCPCSIQDNSVHPNIPPSVCSPASPVYIPVIPEDFIN